MPTHDQVIVKFTVDPGPFLEAMNQMVIASKITAAQLNRLGRTLGQWRRPPHPAVRVLHLESDTDVAIANRAFELAGVDPNDVARDPAPRAYKNTIRYAEIQRDSYGIALVDHRRACLVTKWRTCRNHTRREWEFTS